MQLDQQLPPEQKSYIPTRRLILFMLVLGVLAVVFVVVRVFESHRTPGWHSELERYLQLSESPVDEIRIVAAEKAASPQYFPAERVLATPTDFTWDGISEIPPPVSIQCVRLEGGIYNREIFKRGLRWEILLIGYHNDGLWHSGWLVHQFKSDVTEDELRSILLVLGCNLGLDNLKAVPAISRNGNLDV